jgi:hypothetical protein
MLNILYRLLLVFILFLLVWNILEEKKFFKQASIFLIIIPFLLRVLNIR